jgi:hypothetical protein
VEGEHLAQHAGHRDVGFGKLGARSLGPHRHRLEPCSRRSAGSARRAARPSGVRKRARISASSSSPRSASAWARSSSASGSAQGRGTDVVDQVGGRGGARRRARAQRRPAARSARRPGVAKAPAPARGLGSSAPCRAARLRRDEARRMMGAK